MSLEEEVENDGGRFIEMLEVYDKERFHNWLMKYEFIALHLKDNNYIVIPVEDILKSYHIH